MFNIITFIVFCFMYLLIIVATVLKIKDISDNPYKYEDQELVNRTNHKYKYKWDKYCRFYKSLSHQYSMVTFIFSGILTFIGSIIIWCINKMYVGSNGYIFLGTQLIGVIGLLFLSIPIGMCIIPLLIKKPFFVVTTLDMFNTKYRPKIYLKSYLSLLIIFILTFPFIVLSCNNYGYYDSEGIYVNKYFQVVEEYTSYKDVDTVEIYVNHDTDGNISSLDYVVYMNSGDEVNINSPNTGKTVFAPSTIEIHQYLKNTNTCNFVVTDLTDDDIQMYKEKLSKEEFDVLVEIFNVNKHIDSIN